jgi:hypothetical protein
MDSAVTEIFRPAGKLMGLPANSLAMARRSADDSTGECGATTPASATAAGPEIFPEAADAMVMPFPSARKTAIILGFFMIPSCQSAVGPRRMANLSCGTSGRLRSADRAQLTDVARRGSSFNPRAFQN